MKMILTGGTAVLLASTLLGSPQQHDSTPNQAPVVRRLAATAQLAAQEYRIGIVNGRVVSQAEVDEARLFLQESRRSAALLPARARPDIVREIDSLLDLVEHGAAPDSVDARVKRLASSLSSRFAVPLDEIPGETPSLARGASVYQANCASCHGSLGRGDGPLAGSLNPRPADLSDPRALQDQSPLDYYR